MGEAKLGERNKYLLRKYELSGNKQKPAVDFSECNPTMIAAT
jgi:hypothetical protein